MSREITRARREWLEGEVSLWRRMGLLGEEQAQALMGLYESTEIARARQQSKGILTLLALAATFVGLGVLLLIGYNWDQMPAVFKVAAVFSALVGTHAAGGLLRYQYGWRRLSEVAFFLGCLFFGAALFLLAQVFHISSDNYDALWWWALCTLPFALLLDTILLHLLLAALLALWVGFEVLSLERLFWGVRSGGYTLPLLVAPGVWWAYRKESPGVLGIYLPLLTWWLVLLPFAWRFQADPTFFIGAIGSLLLLVAAMHPPRSPMAIPFRLYGAAIVGGMLVPLSFYSWHRWGVYSSEDPLFGSAGQMVLILILAAVTFLAAYFLQGHPRPEDPATPRRSLAATLREILRRQAVPCALLVVFASLAMWSPLTRDRLLPTIAANVAMIALAFWLIRLGLAEDRGRPFGAGVAYLLLWTVLRYVDLFGAFGGMLGAAVMFFLCGATLFGVALYWRNRKAVSLA